MHSYINIMYLVVCDNAMRAHNLTLNTTAISSVNMIRHACTSPIIVVTLVGRWQLTFVTVLPTPVDRGGYIFKLMSKIKVALVLPST